MGWAGTHVGERGARWTDRPRSPRMLTASLEELADRARGLAQEGSRTLLGITGAPGAGKSTLSAALLSALGDRACAVPMDGFHLANQVLEDLGRRQREGAWDTFDVGGYIALLQRLRAKEEVIYAPSFERSMETAVAAAIAVPRGVPLVITEGKIPAPRPRRLGQGTTASGRGVVRGRSCGPARAQTGAQADRARRVSRRGRGMDPRC